ncbi:hypothetical protein AJ80_02381 [Polytolypa hystricis UAMH7299]|uniref:protein-tyrosine-phosphatase n=1 Tax=Polytolypa hystricis (strain UAMH7299) TaxID=1447883 RepID=A0A2B7YR01_POLH7|nr:hypothetical protein AJ80_02381 [Polytolypa hystricis UAMH7299]
MAQLTPPTLSHIKAVPGLFISDSRFAARSIVNLRAHNIVRILSVVQPHEEPGFDKEVTKDIEIKTIDIDDASTVDILEHLQDACDWVQKGLESQSIQDPSRQGGVLIHCKQGISRSGSFIIAYLMRKFQLTYSAALDLARESRSFICPNDGFEKQLRVWEYCKYDIYMSPAPNPSGELVHKEKLAYQAWKSERDNLLKQGEEEINRARVSSMANMTAYFGKRRLAAIEEAESGQDSEASKESVEEENKRRESWERVRQMEDKWNERLKREQGKSDWGWLLRR